MDSLIQKRMCFKAVIIIRCRRFFTYIQGLFFTEKFNVVFPFQLVLFFRQQTWFNVINYTILILQFCFVTSSLQYEYHLPYLSQSLRRLLVLISLCHCTNQVATVSNCLVAITHMVSAVIWKYHPCPMCCVPGESTDRGPGTLIHVRSCDKWP